MARLRGRGIVAGAGVALMAETPERLPLQGQLGLTELSLIAVMYFLTGQRATALSQEGQAARLS